jgi:recombinational DNA repair protein RecT
LRRRTRSRRHCAPSCRNTRRSWRFSACTFIPDYKGLIELAVATHKVVGIRTRVVYEGEEFHYSEGGAGPDIRHTPRLKGIGGVIVGAYAIADLRFGAYKVEWMTFDEIEKVRAKSKSWAKGSLEDWYARKTVVRRLCKTLPSSAKLQAALAHDDAEGEEIPDADVTPMTPTAARGGYTLTRGYDDTETPQSRYDASKMPTPTVVTEEDLRAGVEAAKRRNALDREGNPFTVTEGEAA